MRAMISAVLLFALMAASPVIAFESLQALYEQAEPYGEYDRYIELNPDIEYLGDLWVGDDINVCLIGNGAIIHGRPYFSSISVNFGRLDMSGCVLLGGGYGISYTTNSRGNIFNNTVYGCTERGISTVYQSDVPGVMVWNNIIVGGTYSFFCVEYHHPSYLEYNTVWNSTIYRYAELCPD
jgi:hypothetical protein